MRTINPNIWPFVWRIILFLIGVIIIFVLLPGCSVEKMDRKALDRVEAKAPLLNHAAGEYFKNHPQDTTTHTITLPPVIVNVPVPVPVLDTLRMRKVKDSLLANKDCGEAAINAYSLGWNEAVKQYAGKTIKVPCPFSTSTVKFDNSALYRATDSLHAKDKIISNLQGQIYRQDNQIKDEHGRGNKWATWFWILAGICGIVLGFTAYSKFTTISGYFKKKP